MGKRQVKLRIFLIFSVLNLTNIYFQLYIINPQNVYKLCITFENHI